MLALSSGARAQALVDLCAGPSVRLPVLTPVVAPVDTVLGGTLNPLLGTFAGTINTSLTGALSGQQLGVSLVGPNGNVITAPTANCAPVVSAPNGISLGGGVIDGLGSTLNARATAGDTTSIAIGNGSSTGAGITNAVALGNGANATAAGGVALGANSTAARLNAPAELFTGTGLRTTLGAVSVGSAANERQIVNVAGGTALTDAANVGQLVGVGNTLSAALGAGAGFSPTTGAFTSPSYIVGGNTYTNVGAALAAISAGTVPVASLVQQVTAAAPITVGAATGGTDVNLTGTAGARTLSGLAAGTLAAGSTQAVNGAQLLATNQALATTTAGLNGTVGVFGSGAAYDPTTGALTVPQFAVNGTIYTNVGAAIAALQTIGPPPTTGLVTQATPTAPILVGSATGGTSVNFTGTAGARVLTGVAAGRVAAGSSDAVNGAQLAATNAGIAGTVTALGGGAAFDAATGAFTAPTYTVQGTAYTNVGGAIGALDRGAVKYDIDASTGAPSNRITLAGGDPNTPVLLRNVAPGIAITDAANVGQVRQAQAASMAYTDIRAAQTLHEAKSYTDQQIAAANFGNDQAFARLNQDVREVRREARQAAAVGLAAGSLRYDDRPGKLSLAAGGGAWRGEGGAAFGVGYTTPDGGARFNAAATTAGSNWGVGGGLSITLN